MRGVVVETGKTVPQVAGGEDEAPELWVPDPDYADHTDEEVAALVAKVGSEHRRRQQMASAQATVDRAVATWQAAAGRKDGDQWAQPQGAHDAYPQGAVVTHDGKEWASLTANNVWEPGVSGWREAAGEDGDGEPTVPAWVQPSGAHDAYSAGDRVAHNGQVWTSTADGNVWEPGEYGWEQE